ncbi:hypothetical protein IWX50DRAFT_565040 [Phyllosticta citricarpa]|uniref:RNI-like protein n=1 Tax=Phyllosticta citricarpa TaxID=55181 RepID=A0ABR1LR40_9PEZI
MAVPDPSRVARDAPIPPDITDDVLHIICEFLAKDHDFATLFNCVLAGKRLATPAIKQLYRTHSVCTSFGGGDTENLELAQQRLVVQRWAILWRSIIASTMQETMYPYARYVRSLDLRNLSYLLEDPKFAGTNVAKYFFGGSMSKFRITRPRPNARINTAAVLEAVGDAITEHAPLLEIVSGDVNSDELIKWAPKLSNLRALELWSGAALDDPRAREAIIASCPKFTALSFYKWFDKDVDEKMSHFISGLTSPSLRSFEVIGSSDISAGTYLALNSHGQTLSCLTMNLKATDLPHLPLLKGCTALELLRLELTHAGGGPSQSEMENFNTFRNGMSDWLGNCRRLRTLIINGVDAAADIMTPVLVDENLKLHSLDLDSYNGGAQEQFHKALACQKHLERLRLDGEPDNMTRDDVDAFAKSIAQLHNLKSLKLSGVSDFFHDEHFITLAENLSRLEEFSFTGLGVGDAILPSLAKVSNLRLLNILAISKFSYEGLIDFANQLGPGNRGIVMAVNSADPFYNLDETAVGHINDELRKRVDGKLEFMTFRGELRYLHNRLLNHLLIGYVLPVQGSSDGRVYIYPVVVLQL